MDSLPRRKRTTIEDVVRLSGVSRSSVFRYLNGRRLKPSLQDAVEGALRSSGYAPGEAGGSGLREILVSAPLALGGFRGYADHVDGIMAKAAESGIRVRLSSQASGGPRGPNGFAQRILAEADPAGGVILLGTTILEEDSAIRGLEARGLPFVLINRAIDAPGVSYVSPDFRAAAREAVGHLLSLGRRRIALWDDGSGSYRMQRDKRLGYLDAYARAGLEPPAGLLVDRDQGPLEAAVDRLLSGGRPPDAWFAMDDQAALRVIRAAIGRGALVPDDLAVVGMNDIEAASLSRPSLSSVSLPFFEAGRAAMDILSRLSARPCESAIRVVLGHRLVVRESSGGARPKRSEPS